MTAFVPPYPARPTARVAPWRAFFGERANNAVYGLGREAFETPWRTRRVLGLTIHGLSDPDAIGRVLLDNKANYARPDIVRKILRPTLGNGLFNAEDEDWRVQRRIVAPTFAPGAVAGMAETVAEIARRRIAAWPASGTLDMAREATATTMEIIAATLFSADPRLASVEATRHIEALLAFAGRARITALLGLPNLKLSPASRAAWRGRDFLRETLGAMVDERGSDGGGDDFFGGLIRALYAQFPADEARALAVDNAVTFYVAGHETTANALAWTLYLLAAQPEAQAPARDEATAALDGDIATLPERLVWLRMVLDEAMRLYPPAPRFDRQALADDRVGDLEVRRGDIMSIWPWLVHRSRLNWDEPDAFIPERFAPERKAAIHRHQYIPFGAGPRVCVGARFAIMEALTVLAHWLTARRFALEGAGPMPVGQVTLRPGGGLTLSLSPL